MVNIGLLGIVKGSNWNMNPTCILEGNPTWLK